MIIDGKKIAEELIAGLAARRDTLPPTLTLGVLMGEEDAASASFVRIKERVAQRLRVTLIREMVSVNTTTEVAIHAIQWLFRDVHGTVVQLPLPTGIDTEKILAAIPASRDVDAVNPTTLQSARVVRAPVAEAIAEILTRTNVDLRGKIGIVVGAGALVGAPAAELLKSLGARVSIITQSQGSLDSLKTADVVVLGAGSPGFVKPDMIKQGVILIDAGTSEAAGKLVGDADPSCAEVASIFTPVPGGVGPIAVAMLFKNLFILAEKKNPTN